MIGQGAGEAASLSGWPQVTAVDVLEVGACLEGVTHFVIAHGTIVVDSRQYTHEEHIQRAARSGKNAGHGDLFDDFPKRSVCEAYGGAGNGVDGYGIEIWPGDGYGFFPDTDYYFRYGAGEDGYAKELL